MDLNTYSNSDLQKLRLKIDTELKRRADSARKDLLKKMQKLAADHGMSLEDLLEAENGKPAAKPAAKTPAKRKAANPRKGSTVAPKYRHPEDNALTWTGRGRQPLWVRTWLEGGGALDSLVIPADA